MAEYIERDNTCKSCIHNNICLFQVNTPNITKCPNFKHTADVVEVKRGQWLDRIWVGQEKLWFCSECDTMGSPQWKCCPVCTAFMDGKGEGE
jgi:hypothetical protein